MNLHTMRLCTITCLCKACSRELGDHLLTVRTAVRLAALRFAHLNHQLPEPACNMSSARPVSVSWGTTCSPSALQYAWQHCVVLI